MMVFIVVLSLNHSSLVVFGLLTAVIHNRNATDLMKIPKLSAEITSKTILHIILTIIQLFQAILVKDPSLQLTKR